MVAVLSSTGTSVPTTLLVGLLIAFALQILATGFYSAVAAATLLYRRRSQINSSVQDANRTPGLPHGIGAVLLLTINGVMGLACYFAIKLSLVNSSISGAILGLVIWSAYLLIWVWLVWKGVKILLGRSVGILSVAVTSLLSWLTGQQPPASLAPASLESLQAQMAAQQSRLIDLQQQLEPTRVQKTVKQAVTAIREDASASSPLIQSQQLWQQVERYISDPSQKLTARAIRQYLETLVQPFEQNPKSLPLFDRQTVEHHLAARSDLSQKRQTRIADRLETAWNDVTQPFELSDPEIAAASLPDAAQTNLAEAGWLGLVVLLVQTSLNSVQAEDWAGAPLNQKRDEISAWVKTGRQKLQQQIDSLRQQTREQIRATQQTIITLVWWVLATAVTSGLTAAMAGVLAV